MDRPQQAELLSQLRADAERIALAFGLRYRAIVAEHPRVKSRYGACYSDGLISIRLRHAKTGQPLKYSSLIDTLCHELAHLRHFNHGPQFKVFFLRILGWARQQGIYCPGPQGEEPALGSFVPSTEALAVALRPPHRNGVPVFPEPSPSEAAGGELLPWERRQRLAGTTGAQPPPRGRAPRRPAPVAQPTASSQPVAPRAPAAAPGPAPATLRTPPHPAPIPDSSLEPAPLFAWRGATANAAQPATSPVTPTARRPRQLSLLD